MAKEYPFCSFFGCCKMAEVSVGFNGIVKDYCAEHAKERIDYHIETLNKEGGRGRFDECPKCGCKFLVNGNGVV